MWCRLVGYLITYVAECQSISFRSRWNGNKKEKNMLSFDKFKNVHFSHNFHTSLYLIEYAPIQADVSYCSMLTYFQSMVWISFKTQTIDEQEKENGNSRFHNAFGCALGIRMLTHFFFVCYTNCLWWHVTIHAYGYIKLYSLKQIDNVNVPYSCWYDFQLIILHPFRMSATTHIYMQNVRSSCSFIYWFTSYCARGHWLE